jgi:signal transduction histidine kinase
MPRLDFLRDVSQMMLEFVECDAVEIRLVERDRLWCCEATTDPNNPLRQEVVTGKCDANGSVIPVLYRQSGLEQVCEEVILGRLDPSLPFATENGNVWVGDTSKPLSLPSRVPNAPGNLIEGPYQSLAIIGFKVENTDAGLLIIRSLERGYFDRESTESYEHVSEVLGISLAQRRMHLALRQRVKELTCLNDIAKVAAKPRASLDQVMTESVRILRQALLYENIAAASIELDGCSYSTEGFEETPYMLISNIVVKGKRRGSVGVAYAEERPELDEGPFVAEERNLLDVVAGEMSLIVEARQTEEEKEVLREQLRHADRLATIGQLAAGVAHELNEPLASILGRAQLSAKVSVLPDYVRRDNEKIVTAVLRAREIISKLRLLARHAPPQTDKVNLNHVVRNGLDLIESRCANAGITLVKALTPGLPEITADAGQLYQVLVNLVVNAMQATPDGGRITIRTSAHEDGIGLCVEDTGVGMSEDTLKQIFTPFFTTKEVDEGTGLGLAVVQGIVSSHGGTISVDSTEGRGSRFDITLPLTRTEASDKP